MPPQNTLSSPAEGPTNTTISTSEELSRFARYVKLTTRDLRNSVQALLGTTPEPAPIFRETEEDEEEEGLFVDVGGFDDQFADWVGVTDDAVDCPEDPTHQKFPKRPPPPKGPIQQTIIATRQAAQRAALQALGLTGSYLELGLRCVAEDVGWLTHTATFEDAVGKLKARFPVLGRLEESFGRGAGRGVEGRRRGRSGAGSGSGSGSATGLRPGAARDARDQVLERLETEDIARFGDLEEAPLEDDGEDWEEFPFESSET